MVFINFMKAKENRRRLYFTLFALLVCTALTGMPAAGINAEYMEAFFGSGTILGFADTMSGGAMSRMSVACFGISSYISASIAVQLVSVAVPKLEKVRKDGEHGKKQLDRAQFALSMVFTLAEGLAMAYVFNTWGMWDNTRSIALAMACWLAGTFVTVLLAQKIDDYGIGNGISLVLACNIMGRLPSSFLSYYQDYVQGAELSSALPYIAGMAAGMFLFFLLCAYLQGGMLDIPVRQNRKAASALNREASIPVSVNVSNVLPVIYAASLFSIPVIASQMLGAEGAAAEVLACFSSDNWYAPGHPYYLAGLAGYVVLIIAFAFFSSGMNFSAAEAAEAMRKNGDTIPGVEPGLDTMRYLDRRRKAMAKLGCVLLLAAVIIPDLVCAQAGISGFSFLGTSLLIVTGVLLDFASRIKGLALPYDRKQQLFYRKEKKHAEN